MDRRTRLIRSILSRGIFVAFGITLSFWAPLAAAQTPGWSSPLSPEELFQRVSASVLVVEGLGADGKVLKQGSGVVVGREGIVTNLHVVERAVAIRVRRGTQSWAATIAHIDPEHDLCQLRVPGLPAPPASIRPSSTLRTGERVYAIGAPEGLELTLSEGLISSLRPYQGAHLVQTTAPISEGSSGGGLFDTSGRLVGITTSYVKEGQNLNFALPGEWIAALPTRPSGPPVTEGSANALTELRYWAVLGFVALATEDWATLISASREIVRLKPDFAPAWMNLGIAYVQQGQFPKAISAYREAIRLKADDAIAWQGLGTAYLGQGQPAQAISALREAIRLKPDDAWVWIRLGFAYNQQGKPAEGISAFREAIRLEPNEGRAWHGLGVAYAFQGQPAQAISALREAIRLKPDDADAWLALGAIYDIQGDRAQVMEVYKQLKILDPARAEKFFREVVRP